MNNPIFLKTVKTFDTLKNSNGKYSDKNTTLVNLAEISLKLNIGCNFVINCEFGDDSFYTALDGNNYDFHDNAKYLKRNEVVNFFECLSVTMIDRCFIVSYNSNNQLMLSCMPKKKFPSVIMVRDKNATSEKTFEVKNVFSGKSKTITQKISKGIRPINDIELNQLKTAFNSMLGVGYNKEIVIVNKKDEKTA